MFQMEKNECIYHSELKLKDFETLFLNLFGKRVEKVRFAIDYMLF